MRAEPVDFEAEVRPVLESRCVVCHACYDAPCQLLATSHRGLERGASKQAIYDATRLREAPVTWLSSQDVSIEAWRSRGFVSVLTGPSGTGDDSLLVRMLALGRAHVLSPDQRLPADLPLDINRKLSCPASDEFGAYALSHPMGGMPYGTAELSDEDLTTLVSWVRQGAPGPPTPPPLGPAVVQEVARWETLLNGETLKQKVASRYLFEHWAFAHLYFEHDFEHDSPARPGAYFRIVRSQTPPGEPVHEIVSRRAWDDPGVPRFWYRLAPIYGTIVHKTHIVYPLSDRRMDRIVQLFFASDWEPTHLPAYGRAGANPFTTFDEIPARSRYEFMLDDARYFVMTFIRGPVCRGQVAVDVIQDHFFIAFLDPDRDASVVDPRFLERTKELLALPAEDDDPTVLATWTRIARSQKRYLDERERYLNQTDPEQKGPALDWVWDGDGRNRNAMLTVMRHFDNANVRYGWVGPIPKTAWIIDYPIFERIYYDLVVNFDVFGSLSHQVSTRLYMDHLRMQAELAYLALLPADRRKQIRASWYIGATYDIDFWVSRLRTLDHGTQVHFDSSDPHEELITKILDYNAAISLPVDTLNRCLEDGCSRPVASDLERRADTLLRPLTWREGGFAAQLPEMSLLRVRSDGPDRDAVYTLIANRAHTNVASMFGEADRRQPDHDRLMLVPGFTGSYPNFAFDVPIGELDEFTIRLAGADTPETVTAIADRWGVRRSADDFWQTIDWFSEEFRRQEPVEAGLFDLQRYGNL